MGAVGSNQRLLRVTSAGPRKATTRSVVVVELKDVNPDPLHAMPSTPFHEALCRLALHHVSPAQGPWEIRRRGVTRGGARDWC
jgi:hypothetical protein